MRRAPVVTSVASVEDVPVLVGLWSELRRVGARAERAVNPLAVPDIEQRLAETMRDPDVRIVVARCDGQPAGMAVLSIARPDPLSEGRIVRLVHLVVAPGFRRRGVGHALAGAAAAFAEERQIEHVGVAVYPSLRDASRFFARLGFAPVVVQRIAPVSLLRRRVGGEVVPLRDDVVRRRSRLRRPVPSQRDAAPSPTRAD